MAKSAERHDIAVIGPGAIGGAVAGGLIQAGHRPVYAARSPFETITVTTGDLTFAAHAHCLKGPENSPPADAVFVAVKAHQTESALPWIEALVDSHSTVFILQNGVEHIERLVPLVAEGAELVPVVVQLGARRSGPGRITATERGRLTAPNGTGGRHLEHLLRDSYVDVHLVTDWKSAAWKKLMVNAASGGLCVLARRDNGMFETDEAAASLAVRLMEDVAAVGRAEGATLDPDLPSKILARMRSGSNPHLSSIVVDRIAGAATEWDARNAVVGRLGARHGIKTPLNELITTLIRLGEPSV